ncbi:trans-sulfuration enzyme family protein [Clostridium kluyveri]|uniref:Cystathionine gamma-synthase n=1 Tax=Clostridium kluyveri TaxID=1534 RepID=A0A1L5F5X7_CLOKL|nr:aminotransferase class I/II-fold pyridoxal phosphate-dependent enzyme [Clostridium kluyveri]APM38383.1 cystathionine gamma-synthase [Clostridium kluyveri]UZQ50665.1 aminotransferase class I/II-fold pyridoxal phosphate-dependent enzyme [Clostridium kluyveri]
MKIESLLIHGGIDGDKITGAVSVPIYQTSTYKQEALGKNSGYEYSRTGNPTREAVEKLIADLEEGCRGFAFASGLAAISAVLMLFKSGDKVILSSNVYGGTFRVVDKIFKNFNLEYELVDTSDLEKVRESLNRNQNVKAIFIETPTNPLMTITDIAKISEIARKNKVMTIVDNTFMTPYLQKPIKLGADIVLHSATKYLGGHSDLIAGLLVVNNEELGEKIHFIQNSTGGILNPFDSWLLIRGIKTLSVRMDRHDENANYIAEFLKGNNLINKIYYPGFLNHPDHEIQKSQARGYGAILSFVLRDELDINKFFKGLKLITLGESLGGVESLICHPATMTHAAIPYEIRQEIGIEDGLIRLSVGLENKEDLIEDLKNALEFAR